MSVVDPEILQDFLTESGELLEQFDQDLVLLESTPGDPELLNKVFRALHTIKGSASFLGLAELVSVAHASEDVLNLARRGELTLDRRIMDLLLDAVDVLRCHFDELENGRGLTTPDPALLEALGALSGGAPAPAQSETPAPEAALEAGGDDEASASDTGVRELELPENKLDLIDFMVADIEETLPSLQMFIDGLRDTEDRGAVGAEVGEICEALARSVEFFECAQMGTLIDCLSIAAENFDAVDEACMEQLAPRLQGAISVLTEQAEGLSKRKVIQYPINDLSGRIADLVLGHGVEPGAELPAGADAEAALAMDAVRGGDASDAPVEEENGTPASAPETSSPTGAAAPSAPVERAGREAPGGAPKVEQTIRIEVSRLETLLNLVGELVLQKNRVGALSRRVTDDDHVCADTREAMTQASSDLDRVTGDIQLAVMRARLQSLERLFGKYPRLIRDLSRKTEKKIRLEIEGAETEVDKSVIEELGDPLVHLLRNSADHGIETPEERLDAGKPEEGVIRLSAAQEGDCALVRIIDDGRGLPRERIVEKAIERGLTTADEAAHLSDREVFRFILAAGFSTAAAVSDLSGRGVGMDVVRTNIEKLKGTIDVDSVEGQGTTISIRIPLTVAIMPAMMVGVGDELYAIPLTNIVEIVRPGADEVSTIRGQKVMTLRDSVLPLVNLLDVFDAGGAGAQKASFAVVVEVNGQRLGMLVSCLVGQQEVVIKPLDEMLAQSKAVSGATVRDDGGVSLVVDIGRLVESVSGSEAGTVA